MNRHYDSDYYRHLVKKLRETFSDTSITTDIIAGFPGETEEEFEDTLNFVKEICFDKVHVFPYSIREGTKAAKMQGHLQNATKSERANRLSALCEKIRSECFSHIRGMTVSVLFEAPKDGFNCGYTKNYTPVKVKSDTNLSGEIRNVLITETYNDFCIGELI
jgi:threonylcarbamoyladenosine tRNA methylthiotransferase MtaB